MENNEYNARLLAIRTTVKSMSSDLNQAGKVEALSEIARALGITLRVSTTGYILIDCGLDTFVYEWNSGREETTFPAFGCCKLTLL